MAEHERFEEFCAVAAAGHLTGQECVEFQSHLNACGACRTAYAEFSELVVQGMPHLRSRVGEYFDVRKTTPLPGSGERFLRQARMEGIVFSQDVQAQPAARVLHLRPIAAFAGAFALVALAVSLTAFYVGARVTNGAASQPAATQIAELSQSNAVLQANLAERDKNLAERSQRLAERDQRLAVDQEQLTVLEMKVEADSRQLREMSTAAKQSSDEFKSLSASLAESHIRLADLQNQMRTGERQLADANSEMSRLRNLQNDNVATLVAQQSRIHDLTEQLQADKATLDTERRLLATGRDVRAAEVMGARQLHIVDVHDSDSSGRQRPAFGRIFYSEGKELIFYAFDLHEARVADARNVLQVWGQQEGLKGSARSLGFLSVDDKGLKRWAMKISNPDLLKAIDSVFVTVEPGSGGKVPSGHKLLYAYLGEPNHP